ncbi:hypothetical protein BDR06DRAFT_997612 [Suillus hirtellus]|nr:hypothetical protein BDR06DRAFT_997612 [Suillus hirtellus]
MNEKRELPNWLRATVFGWHAYYFGIWVVTYHFTGSTVGLLEEQRWLLGEGLAHRELRDEVYCQLMKGNLNGILAISKKGPRIKPLTMAEIETASDAAFNSSTPWELLDVTSPSQSPIPLRRILALGIVKVEGIYRVPGDSDFVSELKLRIDRGNYTPDGVDDPHVLALLLKLWSRKLCDPLMYEEMYKDCITHSHEPGMGIQLTVTKLTWTNSGAGDGTGLAECDHFDADNDNVPVMALVPVYHRPTTSPV